MRSNLQTSLFDSMEPGIIRPLAKTEPKIEAPIEAAVEAQTAAQEVAHEEPVVETAAMESGLLKVPKESEEKIVPEKQPPVEAKAPSVKKRTSRAEVMQHIYKKTIEGMRAYFKANKFRRAVVGVSGGVDSALTIKLAVDALGGENVIALLMPELGLTKQENIDHSKLLCEFLGVKYHYQPINNYLNDFGFLPWKPSKLAQMNVKARVRMILLYNCANTENALVLGTSNKSETLLGYGTKFGDMAADIEVIGELFKTEVVQLAEHVGLPPEITQKKPSAELTAGQTDEEEMGATYQDMDKVLSKLELGAQGCIDHGLPASLVNLVFKRLEESRHKREPIPTISIE